MKRTFERPPTPQQGVGPTFDPGLDPEADPTDGAVEIHFKLAQDDEGWPPVPAETIWARDEGEGRFVLLNVPFFALGVSRGDLVEVTETDDGVLHFARVVEASGHSTLRIIAADPLRIEEIAEQVMRRGCDVEAGYIPALVSVDVPPQAEYPALQRWLDDLEAAEVLDYEESNLAPVHAAAEQKAPAEPETPA